MPVRSRSLVILAVTLLGVAAVSPVAAKPNTGAYAKSSEAMNKQRENSSCPDIKMELDKWERWADQNAGTPKAEKYAKEADAWWGVGVNLGCSWTK